MNLSMSLTNKCNAQTIEEIEKIENIFEPQEKYQYKFSRASKNEFKIVVEFLFFSYKNFVSPYDLQYCGFYPSCSVYTIESIRKKGIVIGILAGSDRLLRCNGLSPEKYSKYENTNYLYDPVEDD